MNNERVTLAEVINTAVERQAKEIRTWMPAKVTKWDASKQRANCQPLVQDVQESEEGSRVVKSMPVITGVPVQFMGAGGMRLTFPVEEGTIGTLFFSHISLDRWLSGDGAEVDPELDCYHSPTDAVFVPGLMPFGAPYQSCPTDAATIGDDADGNGRIHFPGGEVLLGDGASKNVARKTDKLTASAALTTWAAAVEGFINGLVPGTISPLFALGAGLTTGLGEIAQGSNHIKAVD